MKKPIPFGKYYLLDRINVGGMAEVFKAKAYGVEGFERLVAVKRILPSIAEDSEFIEMFIDEAKISVQLTHANIAQIFDLGKVADAYFIALEFIHGKDLRAIFDRARKKGEPIPIPMACYVIMKLCEGLDYAHNKKDAAGRDLNLVHRDVSPQNILISYDGEVKIIDFGIAKAAGKASKTQAGILKGKFGYMSPEQVRGLPLDRRSDIFSVGIALYEILTGERLFVGESDFSTLEKVRNVEIMPPSTYNRKIPEELEQIVLKALAKDVDERYATAMDLHDDLQSFMYTSGNFFARKDLAAYMRKAFSDEIAKEAAKDEELKKLEVATKSSASDLDAFEIAAPPSQPQRISSAPPPPPPPPPPAPAPVVAPPPSAPPIAAAPPAATLPQRPTAPPERPMVSPVTPHAEPVRRPTQPPPLATSPAAQAAHAAAAAGAQPAERAGAAPAMAASVSAAPAAAARELKATLMGLPQMPPVDDRSAPAPGAGAGQPALDMDWDEDELATSVYANPPDGSDEKAMLPDPATAAKQARAAARASSSSPGLPAAGRPTSRPSAPPPAAPPPRLSVPPTFTPEPQPSPPKAAIAKQPAIAKGPAAQPARERSGGAGIALVLLAVVLLGAGGVYYFFLMPKYGEIVLETRPAQVAEVSVDGRPVLGTGSPFTIPELEVGEHAVRVQAPGYRPWVMPVTVETGTTHVLAELVASGPALSGTAQPSVAPTVPPAAPTQGGTGFSLETEPAGAKVFVNDRELAQTTPVRVTDLQPGRYRVRVEKSRSWAPITTEIDIAAGQILELPRMQLTLREVMLHVRSEPAGAKVTLLEGTARTSLGRTPVDHAVSPTGSYRLLFEMRGRPDLEQALSLPSNQEETTVSATIPERPAAGRTKVAVGPRGGQQQGGQQQGGQQQGGQQQGGQQQGGQQQGGQQQG
ncbi:MAG: serine/threonine protein kinase, partial [Deltaproteobacteria bacterium]|nr:serine/threonine protein kinase [Deltaproteobacteria bacterium]